MKNIIIDQDGKSVRACIFCQSTKDVTLEHVFAKKWRKTHGLGYPNLSTEGWHVTQDPDNPVARIDKPHPKRDPFTWTERVACKDCNTGWMSRLEQAVDPYLSKLAFGEEVELSRAELLMLEKWLAKTLIVMETMDEGPKSISLNHTIDLVGDESPDRSPYGMLTWVESVEVNRSHCFGQTIGAIFKRDHECAGHNFRVSGIQIGSIAFVSCYSHDLIAIEHFKTVHSFRLSRIVTDFSGSSWSLDRARVIPSGAIRELQYRVYDRLAPGTRSAASPAGASV